MNTQTSSRILIDVPCKVCHDHSSGKHYGIFACDGCAGFFKRSIRRNRQYACKNSTLGNCPVDKTHRNQCRSCRLQRCLDCGMNKEAVQHERGPRNSTIRKQMALLLKESQDFLHAYHYQSMSKLPLIDQHETAAKILFNAINWIKTIPAFVSLSNDDQLLLLEDNWHDLFLLTAIEEQFPLNINELYSSNSKYEIYKSDLEHFEKLLHYFQYLKLDSNEMIFLKSLLLFQMKPSNQYLNTSSIHYLHTQSKFFLNTYIQKQYPTDETRRTKIFSLVSTFDLMSSLTIEEIFFRKTIGQQTHMKQLVKDMYKMLVQ